MVVHVLGFTTVFFYYYYEQLYYWIMNGNISSERKVVKTCKKDHFKNKITLFLSRYSINLLSILRYYQYYDIIESNSSIFCKYLFHTINIFWKDKIFHSCVILNALVLLHLKYWLRAYHYTINYYKCTFVTCTIHNGWLYKIRTIYVSLLYSNEEDETYDNVTHVSSHEKYIKNFLFTSLSLSF